MLCPNDFPYAFMWGEYCCKSAKDCDDVEISMDSVCCKNNDYQNCSDTTGCKNNRGRITRFVDVEFRFLHTNLF